MHGDVSYTKLPRVSWSRPEELKESLLRRRRIDAKGCWLWTGDPRSRYGTVWIEGEPFGVHRVSAALFNDFPINSPYLIRHTCDTMRCFNPEHLVPGTTADNSRDMVERGRSLKGEASPHSKLTADDVRTIRLRREQGEVLKDLAADYGVTFGMIGHICQGRAWKHVS